MKKNLIALSMMATAGLFAESGNDQPMHQQSGYCNTCCCTPCCCKPCCVPQPKKCIDCECYVPAFYDLQCDWGISLGVDFLYWYARETNTSYVGVLLTQSEGNETTPVGRVDNIAYYDSLKRIDAEWDPGVRVGLGWNSDCDGWDLYLNWTYFKNCAKDSCTSSPRDFFIPVNVGQFTLTNSWTSTSASVRPYADVASASWKVRFNQIDLEIGRKYWLSPCFALRPYAGLRGAWTRTNFNIKTFSGLLNFEDVTAADTRSQEAISDRFKNRHWGVGFLAGIQPTWYFCSNFAFYANMDFAVVWGEQKARKQQVYLVEEEQGDGTLLPTTNTTNTFNDNWYLMSPILDVGLGLRWEETWCCDRYRTALDLGWEHHEWIDHSIRFKTPGIRQTDTQEGEDPNIRLKQPGRYTEEPSNLGYGGFVLRVRFDF